MWGLQGATPCVFHFRVAPQIPHPPVVTRTIPSHSCGDPELGAPHCKLVPSCWTVALDRAGWQPVGMGPRRDIWEWGVTLHRHPQARYRVHVGAGSLCLPGVGDLCSAVPLALYAPLRDMTPSSVSPQKKDLPSCL